MVFGLFGRKEAPAGDEAERDGKDGGKRAGMFKRLVRGLGKTRRNLNEGFERLIGAHVKLDEEFMEELEELLFSADIGAEVTMRIVSDLRRDVKKNLLKNTSEVVDYIKKELVAILRADIPSTEPEAEGKPYVILVLGVNGSGKTTTIGKLAAQLTSEGRSVMLAAGDTFRAAAIDQLETWAERSGCDFVRHQSGSDPSAVAFDAIKAARSRGRDVLIVDTAGRLHSKVNLMEELKKIERIISREAPGAPHETLLVLDSTTGQNAINQAKIFNEAAGVTGIVLTKLDGTAKGGVVINIMETLRIPVRFIGVGEGIEDLRPFDAEEFINAIFSGASFVPDETE